MNDAAPASILVVDDRIENRRLLEMLLAAGGYSVCSAGSGPEALALVAADPPALILLDVRMPGMDGYAVARLLKAQAATRAIPVILVTASNDAAARAAGLEAGVEDFLVKPIDRAELWHKVGRLLSASRTN